MLSVLYDVFSRLFHNLLAVDLPQKMTHQRYDMGFMAFSHTCKKQELEPCIRQTQTYPHIFLSWSYSRT